MNKKLIRTIVLLVVFFLPNIFCVQHSKAVTLKSKREALRSIFSPEAEFKEEVKQITAKDKEKILNYLGGTMHATSKHERKNLVLEDEKSIKFYFAYENEVKTGVALVLTEPGKWGPIQFMVALTLNEHVKNVIVMRYTEVRGRPIARRSFLKQFLGKGYSDGFTLRKDINPIAGATVSSSAAAFTVKKAIVLYHIFYHGDEHHD